MKSPEDGNKLMKPLITCPFTLLESSSLTTSPWTQFLLPSMIFISLPFRWLRRSYVISHWQFGISGVALEVSPRFLTLDGLKLSENLLKTGFKGTNTFKNALEQIESAIKTYNSAISDLNIVLTMKSVAKGARIYSAVERLDRRMDALTMYEDVDFETENQFT